MISIHETAILKYKTTPGKTNLLTAKNHANCQNVLESFHHLSITFLASQIVHKLAIILLIWL